MVNEGKVCFRGNVLFCVCVFLPLDVRRQMQVHTAKLRKKSQVSKGIEKKNIRGSQTLLCSPRQAGLGLVNDEEN